jgi:hypothetical protein
VIAAGSFLPAISRGICRKNGSSNFENFRPAVKFPPPIGIHTLTAPSLPANINVMADFRAHGFALSDSKNRPIQKL